jgi:hypothetical protein
MNASLAVTAPLAVALLVALTAGGAALAAGLGFAVAAMAYTFAGIGVFTASARIASRLAPSRIALQAPKAKPRHG